MNAAGSMHICAGRAGATDSTRVRPGSMSRYQARLLLVLFRPPHGLLHSDGKLTHPERERQREGGRDRQTERDRLTETDRQRETEREGDRQTDRQTDREQREREREREGEREDSYPELGPMIS